MKKFIRETTTTIKQELPGLDQHLEETLDRLGMCAFCFGKTSYIFNRKVNNPSGVMIGGGYYPEVLGKTLVPYTHYFKLRQSPTFASLYDSVLSELDRRYAAEGR